jgi:hypothetical protein
MIDRRIAKIKLRRGTESERSSVIFDEGELAYTTDSKRVYIGDGTTTGGIQVNNKITIDNTLFPSAPQATDIFFRIDEDRAYIYDGTTWQHIGGDADNITIEYDSGFKLKDGGIQREHIGSEVYRIDGGLSSLSAEGIFINYEPTDFQVVGGVFKIIPNSIVTTFSAGAIIKSISGLSANTDNDTIHIVDNKITLQNVYNNQIIGGITPDKISNSFVNSNSGLSADPTTGIYIKTNTNHLNFNVDGDLQLNLTPLSSQKSNTGYQVLHNDFVMQWGQTAGLSANQFLTIKFPLTSWAVCYNVQATIGYNALINNNFVPVTKNITFSSFDVALDYSATTPSTTETATIYWTAVGYL